MCAPHWELLMKDEVHLPCAILVAHVRLVDSINREFTEFHSSLFWNCWFISIYWNSEQNRPIEELSSEFGQWNRLYSVLIRGPTDYFTVFRLCGYDSSSCGKLMHQKSRQNDFENGIRSWSDLVIFPWNSCRWMCLAQDANLSYSNFGHSLTSLFFMKFCSVSRLIHYFSQPTK